MRNEGTNGTDIREFISWSKRDVRDLQPPRIKLARGAAGTLVGLGREFTILAGLSTGAE